MDNKTKMTFFIDSLKGLCNQYDVKIENLCDTRSGWPHAVVKFNGTDEYYNIDMTEDNGYRVGERIYYK